MTKLDEAVRAMAERRRDRDQQLLMQIGGADLGLTVDAYLPLAREDVCAALRAIREPDGHIKTAVMRNIACSRAEATGDGRSNHAEATSAWQAGIDSLLAEGEE